MWSRNAPNGQLVPDDRSLPPITVDDIRRACKSFPATTADGLDRFRPRHLLLLGDTGLELLAALCNLSEISGQVAVLGARVVFFLPTPAGGERPIGTLPTLFRVWCRCRRRIADEWELARQRHYFWAAGGHSSEQSVHHQGLCLEHARATQQHSAALLTDLAKAYADVDHGKLIAFAHANEFPSAVLALCLQTYAGPRRLLSHCICTEWFCIGGQTIIAGCGMATTLLKVYMLRVFDALSRYHPDVEIHAYVDDVDLSASKVAAEAAAAALAAATRAPLRLF